MKIEEIKLIPISIRKLKKYYIKRIQLSVLFFSHLDDFIIFTSNEYSKIEVPNLYINKKIIKRYMNQHNKNTSKKYIFSSIPQKIRIDFFYTLPFPHIQEMITLYYIFDSKSEYLKWKWKLSI